MEHLKFIFVLKCIPLILIDITQASILLLPGYENVWSFLQASMRSQNKYIFRTCWNTNLHPCSKVVGIYFVMSNDCNYFHCIDLNFSCCMMRSFAFIMDIIMCVCYSSTPVWTFKFSKVWKTHCPNSATRTYIWRYSHAVRHNDYLGVMFLL